MEQRASIPVSLPRDNPTLSYWQDPPDKIADLRSTESLPETADTIIIGSGITGAAVAWNLLEKGHKNIVMLEARQACSGATGRNGGHTKAASYRSFLHHCEECGISAAVQIAKLEHENILAVHTFAKEHSIPCDLNLCETIDVVYSPDQWEKDKLAVETIRKYLHGHAASDYTILSPEDVRELYICGKGGDENVCGGIVYLGGSLSAYKMVIGVLKLCLEKGLNLQTNTPALGLKRLDDGRWKIETPRGVVTAQRVVLATNGYTAQIYNKFQGVIMPLRGHLTAQRPGTNIPREGLPATYSFVYEDGYEYMVTCPNGDFVIGGGIATLEDGGTVEFGTTDDTEFNEVVVDYLHKTLPRYFGDNWGEDHPDGRIRSQWTGIMGYSADEIPLVGEIPGEKNLWMSCSFQGHGMVQCWMCARALVEMMEGRDDEQLRNWFPDVYRVTDKRMSLCFKGRSAHS